MKKLFVFGDVHSFYDEFMEALDKAGFDINNPDHIIVSLGDLCDRGPKSREVLSFVNSIPDDRKLLTIGNHEILMELMIKRGYPNGVDTYNGVVNTAIDITEKDEGIEDLKHNRFWNEYKKNRHWYHEIGDYIFIHGWIPCFPKSSDYDYTEYQYMPDWRRSRIEDLYEATYLNGMEMWSNGIRETGKTIFCGHWHTPWITLREEAESVYFINMPRVTDCDEDDGETWYDTGLGVQVTVTGSEVILEGVNFYTCELDEERAVVPII